MLVFVETKEECEKVKLKRKVGKVIKKNEGETYIFKNGIAKIPDMWHKRTGKQYTITLKEFNELTSQTCHQEVTR
jgi:hypothetical protein